jgi:hypothetical protein
MDSLKFVPQRVKLTDGNNEITRPWYLFLQGLYIRVGGALGEDGETTADLAPVQSSDSVAYALADSLGQAPSGVSSDNAAAGLDVAPAQYDKPDINQILAELNALRDQVAELTKTVQDLQQGTML